MHIKLNQLPSAACDYCVKNIAIPANANAAIGDEHQGEPPRQEQVVLPKLRMGHRCGCKLGGFPDLQFDPKSCRGRHVDERIEAKQIDLSAQ